MFRFAPLILLAACVEAGPNPAALPAAVEANLPADVSAQAVGLQGGCYIYDYEGDVFPVTDASGRQICR
ncbi:hypothetical protein [Jannaschia marina]|uniref:hypothetical protein n=1 Tax=Jannaschia marina TaxID=2741674 RepID=UPI0015C846F7|nr:hypothetical protein [Jannaschia marina]